MKKRILLCLCALWLVGLSTEARSLRSYVGTYTTGDGKGIYQIALDDETGAVSLEGLAAPTRNPSFMAFHPSLPVLYSTSELEKGAGVVAWTMDRSTGALTLVNKQPAGGIACHLAVSHDGRLVGVASYGSGTCTVYPVDERGALGPAVATFQHKGHSVDPKRQKVPHAHSANFDPAGRFLVVPDLGLDKLMVYRMNGQHLTPNDPPFGTVAPGSGPRHFAFHPDGRHAYVVNEMGNTVDALEWDGALGTLKSFQTISTLPEDFHGDSTTAHIELHPSGKYLYVSNRGHDSIAVFSIDPTTGALTSRGQTPSGGKNPRHFTQDPTGRFMLVGNLESNSLAVFRIDPESGALARVDTELTLPAPVSVRFAPSE